MNHLAGAAITFVLRDAASEIGRLRRSRSRRFDARIFKSSSHRSLVGKRDWDLPIDNLNPADRRDTKLSIRSPLVG